MDDMLGELEDLLGITVRKLGMLDGELYLLGCKLGLVVDFDGYAVWGLLLGIIVGDLLFGFNDGIFVVAVVGNFVGWLDCTERVANAAVSRLSIMLKDELKKS